jgi:hypothetical protein
MQTYDRLAGICVCAKTFRVALISDSTVMQDRNLTLLRL